MREIRTYGSEGGEAETNRPSLPLSKAHAYFRQAKPDLRAGRGAIPGLYALGGMW